jgi:hypothetical protein
VYHIAVASLRERQLLRHKGLRINSLGDSDLLVFKYIRRAEECENAMDLQLLPSAVTFPASFKPIAVVPV